MSDKRNDSKQSSSDTTNTEQKQTHTERNEEQSNKPPKPSYAIGPAPEVSVETAGEKPPSSDQSEDDSITRSHISETETQSTETSEAETSEAETSETETSETETPEAETAELSQTKFSENPDSEHAQSEAERNFGIPGDKKPESDATSSASESSQDEAEEQSTSEGDTLSEAERNFGIKTDSKDETQESSSTTTDEPSSPEEGEDHDLGSTAEILSATEDAESKDQADNQPTDQEQPASSESKKTHAGTAFEPENPSEAELNFSLQGIAQNQLTNKQQSNQTQDGDDGSGSSSPFSLQPTPGSDDSTDTDYSYQSFFESDEQSPTKEDKEPQATQTSSTSSSSSTAKQQPQPTEQKHTASSQQPPSVSHEQACRYLIDSYILINYKSSPSQTVLHNLYTLLNDNEEPSDSATIYDLLTLVDYKLEPDQQEASQRQALVERHHGQAKLNEIDLEQAQTLHQSLQHAIDEWLQEQGKQPIHLAAQYGTSQAVTQLAKHKKSLRSPLKETDSQNANIIHYAALNTSPDCQEVLQTLNQQLAKQLLTPRLITRNILKDNPLHYAAQIDNAQAIQAIYEIAAQNKSSHKVFSVKQFQQALTQANQHQDYALTPIQQAAYEGSMNTMTAFHNLKQQTTHNKLQQTLEHEFEQLNSMAFVHPQPDNQQQNKHNNNLTANQLLVTILNQDIERFNQIVEQVQHEERPAIVKQALDLSDIYQPQTQPFLDHIRQHDDEPSQQAQQIIDTSLQNQPTETNQPQPQSDSYTPEPGDDYN